MERRRGRGVHHVAECQRLAAAADGGGRGRDLEARRQPSLHDARDAEARIGRSVGVQASEREVAGRCAGNDVLRALAGEPGRGVAERGSEHAGIRLAARSERRVERPSRVEAKQEMISGSARARVGRSEPHELAARQFFDLTEARSADGERKGSARAERRIGMPVRIQPMQIRLLKIRERGRVVRGRQIESSAACEAQARRDRCRRAEGKNGTRGKHGDPVDSERGVDRAVRSEPQHAGAAGRLSRDKHAAARQRQQHVGARARIARRERCRAAIGEGRVEGPVRKQAIDARIRKAGASEGADQIASGDVEFEAQGIRRRRQAREWQSSARAECRIERARGKVARDDLESVDAALRDPTSARQRSHVRQARARGHKSHPLRAVGAE